MQGSLVESGLYSTAYIEGQGKIFFIFVLNLNGTLANEPPRGNPCVIIM